MEIRTIRYAMKGVRVKTLTDPIKKKQKYTPPYIILKEFVKPKYERKIIEFTQETKKGKRQNMTNFPPLFNGYGLKVYPIKKNYKNGYFLDWPDPEKKAIKLFPRNSTIQIDVPNHQCRLFGSYFDTGWVEGKNVDVSKYYKKKKFIKDNIYLKIPNSSI